jgi:hypothetical protein
MERDTSLLTDTGGTSRFPKTPSPGPLRGQAPSAPERDAGLLTRTRVLRGVALVIWLVCVLLVVLPTATGSSNKPSDAPFTQPQPPPGPHRGIPLKQ